ncbi:MAG: precorrin-6A reductase [Thermoguttaceae bacterium]
MNILLLGGTSDTAPIAMRIARSGYRVLVSKATEIPLETGSHPSIEVRSGPLDLHRMAELIDQRGIRAIVDATHPYAVAVRAMASRVAQDKGIAHLSFVRPPSVSSETPGVQFAADHPAAALLAFAHGRPVLLTTGTRNLAPYVEQSRRSGYPLIVRVLDHPESQIACRQAGIPPEQVIAARGPFSVEENRRHIREFQIGALVTKDSGIAGGVEEKLQAAQAEGCRVIVVARPALGREKVFTEIEALLAALQKEQISTE